MALTDACHTKILCRQIAFAIKLQIDLSIRMLFPIWVYRQRESLAVQHYRMYNRVCCPRPDIDYLLVYLLCAQSNLPYLIEYAKLK